MTNKGGKKSTTRATIAGVFSSSAKAASRCYNTGNISYKGACTDYSLDKAIWVQGVGTGYGTSECYNTGKITVKLTSGTACVGGVSYAGRKLKNCYNTGAVSLTEMVWSVVSRQSSMMVTAIIIPVKFQEKAKRFTKVRLPEMPDTATWTV